MLLLSKFFEWEPAGSYHYFNLAHILIILFTYLGGALICYFCRNLKKETVKKTLLGIWIFACTCDVVYWTWELIVSGTFHWKSSLPLYYCSLFYMVLPFTIFPKNEKVKHIALAYIASFNFISGSMGLIFNTHLNVYPVWSFVGVRSLLYHAVMVFTTMFVWATKYYRPKIWDTITFLIPIAIIFIPALITNTILGTDYFYLNGGIGTPIEIFSKPLPKIIYIILLYVVIVLMVDLVFYIPTIVKFFKERKTLKTQPVLQTVQNENNTIEKDNVEVEDNVETETKENVEVETTKTNETTEN